MMEEQVMSQTRINDLKSEMNQELLRILDYWINNSLDTKNGGFLGGRDHWNQIIPEAGKGAVLNTRILWTFSAAYNFSKDKRYLDIADRAYNYLITYFVDAENGGLIWSLDETGKALNKRKQIYAQGFGIYGLSEYFKATGNQSAIDLSIELFQLIEKYSFDETNGGYIEALSEDWTMLEDMRLSFKDANEPKSMNTHLHILEPYTNLYRVWKDEALAIKMKKLIRTFLDKIINQTTGHFELFFGMNWEIRSSIISFGHDIEGAWLLVEAAHELHDADLIAEVECVALKMVDATIAEGMCEDGSIYNEKEEEHLDSDKHWWPQAETLVGLLYAFKISGKLEYLDKLKLTWKFIKQNIIDLEGGEWFWRVDDTGRVYTQDVKMGFWKCPYHNSRSLIEVLSYFDKK